METWIDHFYLVPKERATLAFLSELMKEASIFPNTITLVDLQELLEKKKAKNKNLEVFNLGNQINGVVLEFVLLLDQSRTTSPIGHNGIHIYFPMDILEDIPGKNDRLQAVLQWFFKRTNALWMNAWGQNDEFERPSPKRESIEAISKFPSGCYMLSNELVELVGRDRLAALGSHGDIDGAGMWLRYRDDYYRLIDEATNERKTDLFKEMWAGWIKSRP